MDSHSPGPGESSDVFWGGIYTDPQAERDAATYREACMSCHGEQTPPLTGNDFTSNWNGMSVADLFEKMQVSMPADGPGQLSKDQDAGILAFLLKFNKFPTGARDLPSTADALKGIRFEAARTDK